MKDTIEDVLLAFLFAAVAALAQGMVEYGIEKATAPLHVRESVRRNQVEAP